MYPVTDTFLKALRSSHTLYTRVDAYYGGVLLEENLPVDGGQVTVNAGTGVRRSLTATLSDRGLWDTLAPIGTELYAYRGIRYPNGVVENVPLGVFGIDAQNTGLGPGGKLTVRTAPDRWAALQRARFETPEVSNPGDLVVDEIARLVTDALPSVVVVNSATSTATIGSLVWERDRDKALIEMLAAIGAEGYFDWTGQFIIRDAPLLSAAPSWTVDASAVGVLLDGDRARDRTRTYNVVVVTPAAVDGSLPWAPVVVEDSDPDSPTWVGGPMGRVPYFVSSPLIRTALQAAAAGETVLNRVKSQAAQLSLTAVVNPALDRGDVIWAATTGGGVVERHLLDALTVPLTVDGTQQLTTRSSRPDGDVPSGE